MKAVAAYELACLVVREGIALRQSRFRDVVAIARVLRPERDKVQGELLKVRTWRRERLVWLVDADAEEEGPVLGAMF
jgi:hypothetical protein